MHPRRVGIMARRGNLPSSIVPSIGSLRRVAGRVIEKFNVVYYLLSTLRYFLWRYRQMMISDFEYLGFYIYILGWGGGEFGWKCI